MNAPRRLAAFAAVLGLAFGGAALAGAAIDPTDDEDVAADAAHGGGHAAGDAKPAHRPATGGGAELGGLAVSDGGYTLNVDRAFFSAGRRAPLTFRITDGRGRAVRDAFEIEHDKRLHLIVVRRDTAVFEHVHPRQREDGTWSVDLNLREPGTYRAYADFKIGGVKRTLAADLFVPGDFRPNPLPAPAGTDRAVDLDVALTTPGIRAARETPLTFAVTRAGRPFTGLEPYLGAKGHLVALREGDLAYLHSHPVENAARHGSEVGFAATFPTPGRYRLFLQFKTGGEVHTVAYTLQVPR